MAIRVAKVGSHRTLAAFAKALYNVGNRQEALDMAVLALRRANPQVAEDKALKPGMTLIAPELTAIQRSPTGMRADADVLVSLALARAQALAGLAGEPLEAAVRAAFDRATDAHDPQTVDAILTVRPDLREQINAIQDGAALEFNRIKAAAERARATIDAMTQDIRKRAARPDN
ncbi:hypothetical protein [Bradyrhizobium sp. USDA 3458]|uniref:hypothetical protein n=1 Tax=Bradyrhizobium sp. USDA 3458 TaxID=2591461 RepID=UPI001143BA2E|nr:hypothetical protein [Bradyrhizobium sp. USDA 3458]